MPRVRLLVALIAALGLAVVAPARAETTAERLQRQLWDYGDTGQGWTGADGTYSVQLPDGRTAWIFSDTFLGPVNPDGSRPTSAPFLHNSIVVQDGEEMTTLVGPNNRTLIETLDRVTFYWVGDAVVEGAELLVFVNRFAAAPIPFAFQQIGTDVARFSLPSLTLTGVTPMPHAFFPAGAFPVTYGAAIMTEAGYHYVYGVEDIHLDKSLHLARVPVGRLLDAAAWEYLGPDGWSELPLSRRLMSGVANELSVTRISDGYALVTQDHAIGRDIVVFKAPAPEGPWTRVATFDTAPAAGLITYNAKAHEQFSVPGTLVVSYNVNSLAVGGVYANVANYRPRFVEISV